MNSMAVSVCAATSNEDDEVLVLTSRAPDPPSTAAGGGDNIAAATDADNGVGASSLSTSPNEIGTSGGGDNGGACYGQIDPSSERREPSPVISSPRTGVIVAETMSSGADGLLEAEEAAGKTQAVAVDSMEEECGVCLECMPRLAVVPCRHHLCGETMISQGTKSKGEGDHDDYDIIDG